MATLGQQFKQARNERGLSIEDVAFQTHIPASRVRDMEMDDLSQFGNLTYARGFLKLYGEFLGMDLSDYLSQFRTQEFAHASGHEYVRTASATGNLPAAVFVDRGRARRPGLYLLAAAGLVATLIVWWARRDNENTETASSGNKAAPVVEKSAPAPVPPPAVVPPPAPIEVKPAPEVAAVEQNPPEPAPPVASEAPPVIPPAPPVPGKPVVPPKAKVIEEEP